MRSRGSQYVEGRGYGLIIFASVLLLVAGFWNLIQGISAIAKSHVYVSIAHYVFGDLRSWGWVTLILSILMLLARVGVLVGNQLARWFAVAVVGQRHPRRCSSPPAVLVPDDHRHRHRGAVRALRLRRRDNVELHLSQTPGSLTAAEEAVRGTAMATGSESSPRYVSFVSDLFRCPGVDGFGSAGPIHR
jgi:hypothetical protein